MQTHFLNPSERVRAWREHRRQLSELPFEQAIDFTLDFWNKTPVMERWLDWDFPDTWPTPWEILAGNEICSIAVTILMHDSLKFSNQSDYSEMSLQLFHDRDKHEMYFALVVKDLYVLKYGHMKKIDYDSIKHIDIQHKYIYSDQKGFIDEIR